MGSALKASNRSWYLVCFVECEMAENARVVIGTSAVIMMKQTHILFIISMTYNRMESANLSIYNDILCHPTYETLTNQLVRLTAREPSYMTSKRREKKNEAIWNPIHNIQHVHMNIQYFFNVHCMHCSSNKYNEKHQLTTIRFKAEQGTAETTEIYF